MRSIRYILVGQNAFDGVAGTVEMNQNFDTHHKSIIIFKISINIIISCNYASQIIKLYYVI